MVLTFDEPMLADNPATDPDSVYNTANYQIYDSNGNLLSGVVTHVDYGLSEVSQVANLYGFTNINSTSDVPDNKWEVVLTIDDFRPPAGRCPTARTPWRCWPPSTPLPADRPACATSTARR